MRKSWFVLFMVLTMAFAAIACTFGAGVPDAEVTNKAQVKASESGTTEVTLMTDEGDNNPDGACPTRREVNDMLFGLNANGESYDRVVQVSTEDGTWQVNTGNPEFHYSVSLPEGTVTTLHRPEADLAEVYDNLDGQWTGSLDAFRLTVRFQNCFSPDDDMWADNAAERILVKENFDGTWQEWASGSRVEDWQYAVIAGNFECQSCPTAHVEGNLASNRSETPPVECPQFGNVNTSPGADGGAYCKYRGEVVTDAVPSGYSAEYWDGSAVQYASAGESITTGEATFRPVP